MSTHPALAGLQAALDADPLDATARLVLADWYEEQGDEEAAACHRWMAREGEKPDTQVSIDGFSWRNSNPMHPHCPPKRKKQIRRAMLPTNLFRLLRAGAWKHGNWCSFPTRQAAEDALLSAWRALPPSERPA